MLSLSVSGGVKLLLPRSGWTRVVAKGESIPASSAPKPASHGTANLAKCAGTCIPLLLPCRELLQLDLHV